MRIKSDQCCAPLRRPLCANHRGTQVPFCARPVHDKQKHPERTWRLDPFMPSAPGSTAAPYDGGADPAVAAVRAGTNPEFASQVRTMTGNSNTCFVNSVLHTVSALVEEARNFAVLSFLLQQCLNQLQDSRPLNPIMQSLRPALASSELEVRRQATGCCGILYGTSRRQRGRPAIDDQARSHRWFG